MLDFVKSELLKSNNNPGHPFRLFWFASAGEYPEVRTVVNRKADSDFNLWFFTDSRSPKVQQIHKSPKVSALFYHPEYQFQLRIKGDAKILKEDDQEYLRFLKSLKTHQLKDYHSYLPPGSPVTVSDVPISTGKIYFAVVQIIPTYLDILQIGKDVHHRSRFDPVNGKWTETELIT